MDKAQKLLLLANGFFAALAARGVTQIPTGNMAFEGTFLRAWHRWQPTVWSAEVLPKVELPGMNQPRMILLRVESSDSPFKDFRSEGINRRPLGSTPVEFLEDWCFELPVADWLRLADLFLEEMEARNARIAK